MRARVRPRHSSCSEKTASLPPNSRRMEILVADDDAITRLMLASALRKLGHNVQEAENGEQAWELWQRERQPLIISDWMMPDVDGLELCRRVRARPSANFTYVILLTACSGKANYLAAMEACVDDFVAKPFDKDQLAARGRVAERILGLHVNLHQANDELERRVAERTAELQDALRAKSAFLSRASHELRTPMNHVLGFAQLLEMDELNADQRESVEHILASGHHLLTLIDHILAPAKSSPDELNFDDKAATALQQA